MRARGARRGRTTVAGVEFVRLGAGTYRTSDGRFSVLRDEHTGSSAWILQDRRTGDPQLVGTLRSAARAISRQIAAEAAADRSTAPEASPRPAGAVDGSAGVHRGPAESALPGGCSAVNVPADPTPGQGGVS